jgi:predicted nucleic acid-binding protein
VHYSVISRAELLAGSAATDAINILLGPFRELGVSRPIAERAGEVHRETGVLLPDALIAATAIEEGLALVTRNRKDFARIRGLHLGAP